MAGRLAKQRRRLSTIPIPGYTIGVALMKMMCFTVSGNAFICMPQATAVSTGLRGQHLNVGWPQLLAAAERSNAAATAAESVRKDNALIEKGRGPIDVC